MKKLSFFAFFLLGTGLLVSAQKKIYDENAEVRSVSGFHAIKISNGIDLYLSEGDEAVAVSASEIKYREQIRVAVEDGVLTISYDPVKNVMHNNLRLKAYVSYKNLHRIQASAGSDIKVYGTIKTDKLQLQISYGSDFNGRVEVDELTVEQHSGSDISVSGFADKLTINATSGSDFDGYDLKTEVCRVEAKSGSDVNVLVAKELFIDAGGSSDVHYRGSPAVTNVRTKGGSSVRKRTTVN